MRTFLLAVALWVAAIGLAGANMVLAPAPQRPPPACHPGNHGLIRGRPQFINNAIVAEDGCLLRGVHSHPFSTINNPSVYQAFHDTGHFNVVRILIWCAAACTSNDFAELGPALDQAVDAANQSGMYVIFANDQAQTIGQYTYAQDQPFWNFLAPRYAGNTNVIYEVTNEPDGNFVQDGLATYTANMVPSIRNLAPSTPLLLFTPFGITYESASTEAAWIAAEPSSVWSNAAFSFHGYLSNGNDAVTRAKSFGIPTIMDEQCNGQTSTCSGPDLPTLEPIYGAAGIPWILLDGDGFCDADNGQCYGNPHGPGDPEYDPIHITWLKD